jgi:hypothetical protein
MKTTRSNNLLAAAIAGALTALLVGLTSTSLADPVPVTVKSFARAESDLYFGNSVKLGGFGKFYHNRTLLTAICGLIPAVFVGGWALQQLWLFWVAPLIGAALAGIVYPLMAGNPKKSG